MVLDLSEVASASFYILLEQAELVLHLLQALVKGARVGLPRLFAVKVPRPRSLLVQSEERLDLVAGSRRPTCS